MKKETRVTHPPAGKLLPGNDPVVTPVYRTVKFTFPTIESSLTAEAKEHGFDYTRDSNPTASRSAVSSQSSASSSRC